ncbi:MAG: hypothetical protein V7750_04675 [Sneathiella sp.]
MPVDLLKSSLEATNILILSQDETVRHLFENAGFRHIQMVRQDLEKAERAMSASECDIVIVDDIFANIDIISFITKVRNSEYGENFCLPVVVLISDVKDNLARDFINAGVDDVVLKPLSVNDVNKRMKALLARELLYVVLPDYIGPNRRSAERTNPKKDNLVAVPNALKMKAEGYLKTSEQIEELMSEANKKINSKSAVLDGEIIQQLIKDAISKPKEFEATVRRLRPLVRSFAKKMAQTEHEHISDLCILLNDIVGLMGGGDDTENIEILTLVGQALHLSFEEDKKSMDTAAEIISLIKSRIGTLSET